MLELWDLERIRFKDENGTGQINAYSSIVREIPKYSEKENDFVDNKNKTLPIYRIPY